MAQNVAQGAVHIAVTAVRMITQLDKIYFGVDGSPYQPPKRILSELPILISLLRDIQNNVSNYYTEPPPTIGLALKISVDRFKELTDCLAYMGLDPMTGQALPGKRHRLQRGLQKLPWASTSELRDATKRFRSALTLLRHIAMDHRTHDLITQQRAFLRYEFDIIRVFLEGKQAQLSPQQFIEDTFAQCLEDDLKPIQGQPLSRFNNGFGTLFSITFSIDVEAGEKPYFYPARAKYDTGCPDCLISDSIIRKYSLESFLESFDVARRYTGLGNNEVISTRRIHLNWSVNNETLSRRNEFYVVPKSPFELLLGENFILDNSDNPLLPALPIRLLNGKSKAQKKLEADRNMADNRRAAELTAQRRRGKVAQSYLAKEAVTSVQAKTMPQRTSVKKLEATSTSRSQRQRSARAVGYPSAVMTTPTASVTPITSELPPKRSPKPAQVTESSTSSEQNLSGQSPTQTQSPSVREDISSQQTSPLEKQPPQGSIPTVNQSSIDGTPKSQDIGKLPGNIGASPKVPNVTNKESMIVVKPPRRQAIPSITEKDLRQMVRVPWAPDEQIGSMRRRWSLWT